jgi:hypothetical protein
MQNIKLSALALVLAFAATMLAACNPQGLPSTPEASTTPSAGVATMTAQQGDVPADFSVTYEWRAGTMPPPYHYEYTVKMGPGNEGSVVYVPDYPSDKVPTWTETFTPTAEQMSELYTLVVDHNLLRNLREAGDPPVGGSVQWAEITADGKTYVIPRELSNGADREAANALYDFVRDTMVPKAVWDKLEGQRQEYEDNYEKK